MAWAISAISEHAALELQKDSAFARYCVTVHDWTYEVSQKPLQRPSFERLMGSHLFQDSV